jgi:2-polyprenyl-3-methyl-5-hydroxy-6-metoxy-1,4-benzoquinol methylase
MMDAFREFVFSRQCTGNDSDRSLKSFLGRLYNTLAYRSIPTFIENGALLDVGSGLGTYLLLLRSLGWRVHGIEASRSAASYAQDQLGLDVKCGLFEDVVFPKNFFDVITMWHSLEHFADPRSILLKAHRLLKPGGKLLIAVPNYASMDRKIFGENWNGLEIPLHLFHFNPCSIQTALERTGFHCGRVMHTIRPSDFAKSLGNLLKDHYGMGESRLVRYLTLFASMLPAALFGLLQRSSIIVLHAEKVAPRDQPSTVSSGSGESGKQVPGTKESTPEGSAL